MPETATQPFDRHATLRLELQCSIARKAYYAVNAEAEEARGNQSAWAKHFRVGLDRERARETRIIDAQVRLARPFCERCAS